MKAPDLGPVWKALKDPSRRRILDLLKARPRTTGELANAFPVSRFAVMKHLKVLTGAGLVLVRREGRERWNHLNAVPIQRIYERWISPFQAHWAAAILRLEQGVRGEEGVEGIMADKRRGEAFPLRSFHAELEATIGAPPSRVFEALTREVSAWWGAPYLIGKAQRLVLEPRLGGRFYEEWADGAGALWGTVTELEEDKLLEVTGPVGMGGPVVGRVRFTLAPQGAAGTRLSLSHRGFGAVTEKTGAEYKGGWTDLLATRLKAYVETGKRHGLGHEPPPAPRAAKSKPPRAKRS